MNPQYVQQPLQKPVQGGPPSNMPPLQPPYYTNGSTIQGPPNIQNFPLSGQQDISGPPLQGQHNLSGPLLQGQQNILGPPMKGSQTLSAPPLQGQQNVSSPALQSQQNLPPPPTQEQQNMLNCSLPRQQNASSPMMQNLSGPPLTGQQNLHGLPAKGQQNLSGSPFQGHQNSSSPFLQAQPNISMPVMQGQPISSNSPMSGPQKVSGTAVQAQQSLPSSTSQSTQIASGPSLYGQQNPPGHHLQGQQNLASSPDQGQQNLTGAPALGPQNLRVPPGQAQQNFNSSLQHVQQNLSGLSLHGQHNFNSPQSQGQPNFPGSPLQQGHQNSSSLPTQHNLSGPPLPRQQGLSGPSLAAGHNYLGPQTATSPLSAQQSMSGPTGPSPQNLSSPALPGQQNYGQQSMPGQNLSGPPLQSQMGNPLSPGQPQLVQRQYTSGPPMSGQPVGSPAGLNRQPAGNVAGYQQGGYQQHNYQPQTDMYSGQRSPYQGGASPNYQPGIQPQQARRLDPEQMPSPIQVMQDDQRARGGVFITNQKGLVPPLVTTKMVVQDQGNASPRYIRSTMYTVPTTADIVKQTSVPFGLIISPMAQVVEGEYEPPIVDMGEIGPVRCVRCKAYMSPFMQFIDAGRRFQCMFCKATTEVPAEYFQHLDHTGQRMDRYERPELMLGTYEYVATKDYCRNNVLPKPPAIVFVIDVSYNTVKSGLVNLLCMKMKSIIRNLPIDVSQTKTNMRVGFITYNNTVHFYNINPCLAQPQMMVVGDVQDVFMPLLDGFLCDVEESEAVIDSLMTQIPQMFADTRETETILAPAIQAGLEALKAAECAGKLIIFHSSLPIAEAPGKLKNRDDRKLLGTEKEKTVLAPQNNVYNNLGQECVSAGCSVDLFIFNNSYVDIATIGQIARLTGGEIYKYTYFQGDIDGDRLITDVINNVKKPIAFDAIMRVRTSTGVRATDFYGHFFMSNTTDMELASIDCNKAVAIEVKHDDKLTEDEGVYIQAALLYTSCSGIRRLRIMNISLKTSSQMAELYRACDLDAILNFFSKQSVFKLIESTPKTVKDNLISRCANMLAAYRKHCASPSSAGQLILPECMKLLPLYVNCLIKSDAISGGADMTIDDRSFVMQAVATMPVSISVVYIYPRLYALHDVDPMESELPPILRCSIDKFTDDGVYLLENSIHMFLWLGLAVSPQWIQDVFGVPTVVQVDTDRTALPVSDNPLNKRIRDIINEVRAERNRCMRLTIVRQRDKLEMVLRHFLIEDRGNDGSPSYVDFLCHMHKEIRTILSQ